MFLNQSDLRIPKMSFVCMYFCAMPRNAKNRNLKNDVINGYGFGAVCLPKQIYQPEIWHARCAGTVLSTAYNTFLNFENFGFL